MKSLFERLRNRRMASAFVLLATLSAAIVAGSYMAHGVRGQEQQNNSSDATPLKVVNSPVPPNDFVKIARQVAPAVVNINTQTLPKQTKNRGGSKTFRFHGQPNPQSPGDDNDDQDGGQAQNGPPDNFQDFFNRFFGGQMPDGGDQGGGVQESLGSGFIVDPKGYIITNYHVVEKADKIYVKLSSDPDTQDLGRPARVIGSDKATDLAVIKIDASTPLPTVRLGNSDMASVGDWVVAIGSPFALSQTVTAGIISAKNRTIDPGAGGQFQHFIQTDAAINPGNSGGPLLNMNGEVVGVNTLGISVDDQGQPVQGLFFAIPSNSVQKVVNEIIQNGSVTYPYFGIQFQDNSPAVAAQNNLDTDQGVVVLDVPNGSPADDAGTICRSVRIDPSLTHFDVVLIGTADQHGDQSGRCRNRSGQQHQRAEDDLPARAVVVTRQRSARRSGGCEYPPPGAADDGPRHQQHGADPSGPAQVAARLY